MQTLNLLTTLVLLLFSPSISTALHTVTIHYQALTPTSTPHPLAIISYDPQALDSASTALLKSYTPPALSTSTPHRIGLLASFSSLLSSAPPAFHVATIASFPPTTKPITNTAAAADNPPSAGFFRLYLDGDGVVWSVSFSAVDPRALGTSAGAAAAGAGSDHTALLDEVARKPAVELVRAVEGIQPRLNRPVVLSAEGKVEQPAPEKSLIQKYWWVGVAALFLVMMSGGEGK